MQLVHYRLQTKKLLYCMYKKTLNSGKSSDGFKLCAEQLKVAGEVILPVLRDILNEIFKSGTVPDSFKGGILTPVPNC